MLLPLVAIGHGDGPFTHEPIPGPIFLANRTLLGLLHAEKVAHARIV